MKIKRWLKSFGGGHGQKWVWPVWWQDSETDLSKEWTIGITDFFHVGTDSQKLKADQNFLGEHG